MSPTWTWAEVVSRGVRGTHTTARGGGCSLSTSTSGSILARPGGAGSSGPAGTAARTGRAGLIIRRTIPVARTVAAPAATATSPGLTTSGLGGNATGMFLPSHGKVVESSAIVTRPDVV